MSRSRWGCGFVSGFERLLWQALDLAHETERFFPCRDLFIELRVADVVEKLLEPGSGNKPQLPKIVAAHRIGPLAPSAPLPLYHSQFRHPLPYPVRPNLNSASCGRRARVARGAAVVPTHGCAALP